VDVELTGGGSRLPSQGNFNSLREKIISHSEKFSSVPAHDDLLVQGSSGGEHTPGRAFSSKRANGGAGIVAAGGGGGLLRKSFALFSGGGAGTGAGTGASSSSAKVYVSAGDDTDNPTY
jgi:hypothetical protein